MSKNPPNKEDKNLPVAAVVSLPAEMMQDMVNDAGMGVSSDPSESGIPFHYILQDLSPQVKKRDEAFIEGAEVGDIYNNVTKEVISARVGIDWIEVGFEAAHVEWKPNRGGFVAKHSSDTPLRGQVVAKDDGTGRMIPTLPSGNVLTETKYHYGLYRKSATADVPAGPWEPAVIGMASTMIKCSRELESLKKRTKIPGTDKMAPSFAVYYHLGTTVVAKNNNEWFVWAISQVQAEGGGPKWVTSDEYRVGRALAEQVLAGTVKTANPGDETGQGGASADKDDEVL